MAVTYYIDTKQNTVFMQINGVVDGKQISEHQDKLRNDPLFKPNMYNLMDCDGMKGVNMKSIHKSQLAGRSPWGNDARRAIVVPSPLIFGFLRIFQTFMNGVHGDVSIFYNKGSALDWLGIKSINK